MGVFPQPSHRCPQHARDIRAELRMADPCAMVRCARGRRSSHNGVTGSRRLTRVGTRSGSTQAACGLVRRGWLMSSDVSTPASLGADRDVTSAREPHHSLAGLGWPQSPPPRGRPVSGRGARCVAAVPTIAGQRGYERNGGSGVRHPGFRFMRRAGVSGVSSRSWRVRPPAHVSSGVLDSPVHEVDDAIGSVCHGAVVTDHDHRHPVPFAQRGQQVQGSRPAR
jgi:hypothetical protein